MFVFIGHLFALFPLPVLCFTMVLTAVDVLTKYWPFGQSSTHLCRAVKASPCFAVYLASLTIVVISLDRYRCIVHSTKKQLSNKQVWHTVNSNKRFTRFLFPRFTNCAFLLF